MSPFTAALFSLRRRFRLRPLRQLLTFLEVFLVVFMVILALMSYQSSRAKDKVDVFDIVYGDVQVDVSSYTTTFETEDVEKLMDTAPAVSRVARYQPLETTYIDVSEERYALRYAVAADPDFLDISDLDIINGSGFSLQEEANKDAVVLLSDKSAKIIFGEQNPVGQTINLLPDMLFVQASGEDVQSTLLKVIGVYKTSDSSFSSEDYSPTLIIPTWLRETDKVTAMLRVESNKGQGEAAREQMLIATKQFYPSGFGVQSAFFVRELGASLSTDGVNSYLHPNVIIFSLFGILSMVIGCIGVFSSTLLDIAERTHEMGMKRSLGASGQRTVTEFLFENSSLAFLGALAGVIAAWLVLPGTLSANSSELFNTAKLSFDPWLALWVVLGVVFVCTLLGSIPIFRLARAKPIEILRDGL